ncbi:ABC transporter permease [Roseibium sp. M-1]
MAFIVPFAVFAALIFVIPLVFIFVTSIQDENSGAWTLEFFQKFFESPVYLRVLYNTVELSFLSTIVTLLIGYPLAYYLAKLSPGKRVYASLFLLLPFYTSILVKSFGFSVILGRNGAINTTLSALLGLDVHLQLLYNKLGVVIGIVHDMLPFLVFPILISLLGQNPAIHKAAELMGASRRRIFWTIIFPLSLPGVVAGAFLVVMRCLGQYAVPQILGGRQDMMMSNLIHFHLHHVLDFNMAAVLAIVLLLLAGSVLVLLSRVRGSQLFGES